MRSLRSALLCLLLSAALPSLAANPQSQPENCEDRKGHCLPSALNAPTVSTIPGHVTRVVDGDTIDVQLSSGSIRIRLYGIDAPESTQPGGGDARTYLAQRVLHQAVHLEPFQQDRYSRMIAIVYLGDENINESLVREGHAWAYRKYLKRTEADYCRLEADARTAKRGLWLLPNTERMGKGAHSEQQVITPGGVSMSETFAFAPWEYRKRKTRTTFTDYSNETGAQCIAELGKH